MLPAPKVKNACFDGAKAGAKLCMTLCNGEPARQEAGICNRYRNEQPKPTVLKACETGYNSAFREYRSKENEIRNARDAKPEEADSSEEPSEDTPPEPIEIPAVELKEAPVASGPIIIATLPVAINNEDLEMQILEGQSSVEAVAAFCATHMADNLEACAEQLLPHVERKLEEKGVSLD